MQQPVDPLPPIIEEKRVVKRKVKKELPPLRDVPHDEVRALHGDTMSCFFRILFQIAGLFFRFS